jgi:butyrate kinase
LITSGGACNFQPSFFMDPGESGHLMAFLLVINPGSTSTKAALYEDATQVRTKVFRYDPISLGQFGSIWDQFDFRLEPLRVWAQANAVAYAAVVSLGGLLRPLRGGTYRVNEKMLRDARANIQGEHASNLGCAMAAALADEYHCGAYVVDPVSVDEFEPLARYSGHPLISRNALSHALNLHAAARRAAFGCGKPLDQCNFVVAHLGGGISVAPVRGGRIIDVNDASSDGPFSPERTGGLPLQQFLTLCYSGSRGEAEMRTLVRGKGGLTAYLGTNSALEVETRIVRGDTKAREIYEAMAYQIGKEIGAMATVLAGTLDAVVLTGGLARSAMLVGWISDRVRFLAPVFVYPGEDEMDALARGVLRVLQGEAPAEEY